MRNLITILLVFCSFNVFSQEGRNIERLAFGEGDEKVEAIAALVASGDEKALAVLQALADGDLYTSGKRVLIVKGEEVTDAVTGQKLDKAPEDKEDITVNNRLRREV